MTEVNQHIIHKVQAELTIHHREKHREMSELLKRAVQNAVQNVGTVMNRVSEDSFYRIDCLSVEINVPEDDIHKLEERIEQAFEKQILDALRTQKDKTVDFPENRIQAVSPEHRMEEVLSYFLWTGRFPWWVDSNIMPQVENWMENLPAGEWSAFIKPLIQANPKVIKRLVSQFSMPLVDLFIKKSAIEYFGEDQISPLLTEVFHFIRSLQFSENTFFRLKSEIFEKTLQSIITGEDQESLADILFITAIHKISIYSDEDYEPDEVYGSLILWMEESDKDLMDTWTMQLRNLSKEGVFSLDLTGDDQIDNLGEEKGKKKLSESEDMLTVLNGGVVILHPYLESLFKNLGFVKEGEFLNITAREWAVCLVHYLSTGQEEFPEHELLLPKFLCGWQMQNPVNRFLSLNETEKKECEWLLTSTIKHWEALKNTSIEGLRKNFLQREGILKYEEFGWSLYIEKKTQDILLEKLPWALSVIKLKWMKHMLTVQWQ